MSHDVLVERPAKRLKDKRLPRIIPRDQAAVRAIGEGMERREGTPHGGPSSPLLARVVLDEVDRKLERNGHNGSLAVCG